MPKFWWRQFVVDVEDVGKSPRAESVDKGNVGVDPEDVTEAPRAEVLGEASYCSH
jgi:hypothetical protein